MIVQPWIKNSDREVECFHPVCKQALTQALRNLGLNDQYAVLHHKHVGSLEMDFVIANRATNKILCVVEVKRTIPSVYSTRYQYQAMSYVLSLSDSLKESQYYLLTSLECSALFKYSKDRANVYEQLVEPGIEILHKFDEVDKETFIQDLVAQYQNFISIIKGDFGQYVLSFKNFADEVKREMPLEEYRKIMIPLFYEYIRGSFHQVKRNDLRSISQLSNNLKLVCREGGKINFKEIFNPEYVADESQTTISHSLLKELYQLGERYIDADAITNVLHSVISEGYEHDGEVPTDMELGTVIMQLLKCIGGALKEDEKLMDPAAGSGNLISSAITVFEELRPSQIVVNDINKMLLQLLSLRLGLKFPTTISKDNTSSIQSCDIASLPKETFDKVRYVVLNPPYLAATALDCVSRKRGIYERIEQITGCKAMTNKGQMPLEGPFVELVGDLADDNTIIACILPHTHFTARGDASAAIREMLLDRFGLYMIFNYPQAKLFNDVAQNTAVAIGIVGKKCDEIKYLYSNDIISDVDVSHIPQIMDKVFLRNIMSDLGDNFEGMSVPRNDLASTIGNGWSVFNMSKQDASDFILSYMAFNPKLQRTPDCKLAYYRGKIGNNGGSDLLYYKSKKEFADYVDSFVLHAAAAGLRNADYEEYYIREGHSFLDSRNIDEDILDDIVGFYKSHIENTNIRQRRDTKSIEEYKALIKSESGKSVPKYSVLAPRAIRSNASVFLCKDETFVSTNFFVFEMDSEEKSFIYSSWMLSVFFQLECEVVSKNNAGLRKMEKTEYKHTHMPDLLSLTNQEKEDIVREIHAGVEFLNLRDPEPRQIDVIWAKILFGEQYQERMDEAISLLAILSANREA